MHGHMNVKITILNFCEHETIAVRMLSGFVWVIYLVFARPSIFAVCLSLSLHKYMTQFPHSVETDFPCKA